MNGRGGDGNGDERVHSLGGARWRSLLAAQEDRADGLGIDAVHNLLVALAAVEDDALDVKGHRTAVGDLLGLDLVHGVVRHELLEVGAEPQGVANRDDDLAVLPEEPVVEGHDAAEAVGADLLVAAVLQQIHVAAVGLVHVHQLAVLFGPGHLQRAAHLQQAERVGVVARLLQGRQDHDLLVLLRDALAESKQGGANGPAEVGADNADLAVHEVVDDGVVALVRQVSVQLLGLLHAKLRERRVVEPGVGHALHDQGELGNGRRQQAANKVVRRLAAVEGDVPRRLAVADKDHSALLLNSVSIGANAQARIYRGLPLLVLGVQGVVEGVQVPPQPHHPEEGIEHHHGTDHLHQKHPRGLAHAQRASESGSM
eukprot:m.104783 g.104783  ORF g.104783 m.104783 type:complete len:370 (+) comp15768_c3_seq1:54-1163(+)